MRSLEVDTLSNQDISSALLIGTYTADAARKLVIRVFADQVAGDGEYTIYATIQLAGAGSEYVLLPKTAATAAAGETAIAFPSVAIPVANTDVVKVYLDGLAGDTVTPDTRVEWWEDDVLRPTTADRTLDVAATGEAGLDFDNVRAATAPTTLTNITVPTVSAATLANGAHGGAAATLTLQTPVEANVTQSGGSAVAAGAIPNAAAGANGGLPTVNANNRVQAMVMRWLTDDAAGTPSALAGNLVQADMAAISADSVAADRLETMLDGTGGNILSLGQLRIFSAVAEGGIYVYNSAGPGALFSSVNGVGVSIGGGNNNVGLAISGGGSGHAVSCQGGPTGHGIYARGGVSSGDGFYATGWGAGDGIDAVGTGGGSGIKATGQGAGHGITAIAGATGYDYEGVLGVGMIAASSFAAGAIDSAAIATNAIGADEFAQAAADKVWASAARTLTALGIGTISSTTFAAGAIDAAAIADGAIDAGAFAQAAADKVWASVARTLTAMGAGVITSATFAADAITAATLAADVTTELQAGLATSANQTAILGRLPAALVGGRMDASVGAMAADTLTAAALAADAVAEIQSGLALEATLTARTVLAATYATLANQTTLLGTQAKLETMLEADGLNWRFTTDALALAAGTGASAQEVWTYAERRLTSMARVSRTS